MKLRGLHICRFDSADHLTGKNRTYASVKDAVLKVGKFSVFEATSTKENAALFTCLCRDPELETFDLGYPWTGIRRKVSDQEKYAEMSGGTDLFPSTPTGRQEEKK